MPSHLLRIQPTPSAAARKATPGSPAMRQRDGPQQFKVSCGQGPIVMRPTDGGAHNVEPVARVVD
jgi:hypothetical protein